MEFPFIYDPIILIFQGRVNTLLFLFQAICFTILQKILIIRDMSDLRCEPMRVKDYFNKLRITKKGQALKDRMKPFLQKLQQHWRKAVMVLCLAILFISLTKIGLDWYDKYNSRKTYAQIQAIFYEAQDQGTNENEALEKEQPQLTVVTQQPGALDNPLRDNIALPEEGTQERADGHIDSESNDSSENENIESELEQEPVEQETVEENTEVVLSPEERELQELREIKAIQDKFKRLLEINEDVVGWVRIKNTKVDYPVLHAADNDYYLYRNINKRKSSAGSIFMDFRNDITKENRHTIIYGHNMRDGSMFADLLYYESRWNFENKNIIEFETLYGSTKWKIFSAYLTDTDFYYIETNFETDEVYLSFLETLKEKSLHASGVSLSADDRILTLSTCSYSFNDARFVVHAKLIN